MENLVGKVIVVIEKIKQVEINQKNFLLQKVFEEKQLHTYKELFFKLSERITFDVD